MRRAPTRDWEYVGWHYKTIHRFVGPLNNHLFVRAKGLDQLPYEAGFVYAANHSSWWDPIVLQCSAPRPVNWLAKKEMMRSRFNKWFFFDKGGCIPVDRDRRNPEALTAAVKALDTGRIIGIFPEGTRQVGALGPAKTGAARLAMGSGAPVVPAAILAERFWPPGKKFPRLRETIYLNVGAPMYLKGDPRNGETTQAATAQIMGAIGALRDEARAARDARERWAHP